jgi:2-polyprenyl-3-methyl-5-hydroxy-6-metoxy-1,4-benzoquinol methylase
VNIVCPLSHSSNVSLIEELKVESISRLYEKSLGLRVGSEFRDIEKISLYHCIDSDLYFFYPPVTGTEKFYESLQNFDWYYMDEKNEFKQAQRFIKETDSVLEIGCGEGAFAKLLPTIKYVGLEFNGKAREIALANRITVLQETVQEHSQLNHEKYDVVCSFQVLEHVYDINAFIDASVKCLKPGGLFILSVPSFDSFSKYVKNFILDMPPHHVTRWTDKALDNISKYFKIELLDIWHEPLQWEHREFYTTTIVQNLIFELLGMKFKNIDLSLSVKVIAKISTFLGSFLKRGLVDDVLLPRGISVVSIYRKLDGMNT